MKNMLNLRQSVTQTLAMTPQLQQAIRLLQLSQQELEIEIQETLDRNPLLETEDSAESATTSLDAIAEQQSSQEKQDDDSFGADKPVTSDDVPYNSGAELSSSKQLEGSGDFYENEDVSDFQAETAPPEAANVSESPSSAEIDNHEFDTWNENYSAGVSAGCEPGERVRLERVEAGIPERRRFPQPL